MILYTQTFVTSDLATSPSHRSDDDGSSTSAQQPLQVPDGSKSNPASVKTLDTRAHRQLTNP